MPCLRFCPWDLSKLCICGQNIDDIWLLWIPNATSDWFLPFEFFCTFEKVILAQIPNNFKERICVTLAFIGVYWAVKKCVVPELLLQVLPQCCWRLYPTVASNWRGSDRTLVISTTALATSSDRINVRVWPHQVYRDANSAERVIVPFKS